MIIKVQNETPFQVLTGAFTIGPSSTGYELQVGATPDNFATLFSVGANTTRMVTNVANGSYYRLKNNVGEVQVNWSRTCVEQGGGGTTYTAGDYISLEGDVISVTGITPDAYITSADTEDFATKQYVASAVTPVAEHLAEVEQVASSGYNELHTQVLELSAITENKADAKILVDFDHTSQAERAALYAELKTLYDGGSGATINKNYDFYKTVNTWQGLKIDYYGFSGDTMVFGKVVSPENTADQVVYEQVMTIDSAGTVNVVTNTVGGADLSGYWNSAITEEKIASAASITYASAVSNTNAALSNYTPTTGFSTINGSAITNGGNLVIQGGGGGDMSNYWNSAETQQAITQATSGKVSSDGSILNIVKISDIDYKKLAMDDMVDDYTLYAIVATPYIEQYLTFEITDTSDGGEIFWNGGDIPVSMIYYDINYSDVWLPLAAGPTGIGLNVGDIVRFKNSGVSTYGSELNSAKFSYETTAKFKIYGNIMSLFYGDDFVGQYNFDDNETRQLKEMFYDVGNRIASVDGLVLPATALTDNCYESLFNANNMNAKIKLICLAEDNLNATDWSFSWLPDTSGSILYKSGNVAQTDVDNYFNVPSSWSVQDYDGVLPEPE